MASEPNPYAAPLSDEPAGLIPAEPGGIWRDGSVLIMRRDALLPDRCIKCNVPLGGRRWKRSLYWHHPLVYLVLFLCGPIPFILAAFVFRHSATLQVGICPMHLRRRRRAILVGWLLSVLGGALFVMGVLDSGPSPGVQIVAGLGILLVGLIYGVAVSAVIVPKRIDREYVYIKRAGRDYLSQFPAWLG